MIEIPAGKLDAGEAPGLRPARTAGGNRLRRARMGVCLHHAPTVAYSDEFIEIWFARGLELGSAQLDQGEFLDVFTATPEEFLRLVPRRQVVDSKTLAAALWLQNVLSGAWKLDWQPHLPSA
jgi:ADP-ribose pyrophosphatase